MHLFLAFVLLVSPGKAFALAGKLMLAKGKVYVRKAGADRWTPATAPLALDEGDMLKTRDGSSAELALTDGTCLRLSENTDFQFHEAKPSRFALFVRVGKLEAFVQRLGKGRTFQVRTPNSVAAIRGTALRVEVGADGGSHWNLFTGSLSIFDGHGSHVMMTPNQHVAVSPGGSIGAPGPLPPNERFPHLPNIKALKPGAAVPGEAEPAAKLGPAELKIASLTGEIEVTLPDGTKKVYRADNLPMGFSIPAGATVKVLSGSAILLGPAGALQVGEGGAFTTTPSGPGQLDIAVAPGSTKLQLEVNGMIAVLSPKDTVQLAFSGPEPSMVARVGNIPVLDPRLGAQVIMPFGPPGPPPPPPPDGGHGPLPPPPPPPPPQTPGQDLNVVSPSAP